MSHHYTVLHRVTRCYTVLHGVRRVVTFGISRLKGSLLLAARYFRSSGRYLRGAKTLFKVGEFSVGATGLFYAIKKQEKHILKHGTQFSLFEFKSMLRQPHGWALYECGRQECLSGMFLLYGALLY